VSEVADPMKMVTKPGEASHESSRDYRR